MNTAVTPYVTTMHFLFVTRLSLFIYLLEVRKELIRCVLLVYVGQKNLVSDFPFVVLAKMNASLKIVIKIICVLASSLLSR